MVIEKGGEIGNHGISGAVLDPRSLNELLLSWLTNAAYRRRPLRAMRLCSI